MFLDVKGRTLVFLSFKSSKNKEYLWLGNWFHYWGTSFLSLLFHAFDGDNSKNKTISESRLSLIVRVHVVLNMTVVVDSDWRFDNLCASHLQSQSELVSRQLMVLHSGFWLINNQSIIPSGYWLINYQSIIPSTDVIQLTLTLKMTTAQFVETSVTVNNNNPIQDYVHSDDQTQPTFEMTPGFKPFTKLYPSCFSFWCYIKCQAGLVYW